MALTTSATLPVWGNVALVLLLTAVACVRLWQVRGGLSGTTLVGPWSWLMASTLSLASARVVLGVLGSEHAWSGGALVFVAAVGSICPLVSLLGAKRPQDQAWHLIVLSLWVVLALPAVESVALRGGQMPDTDGARSWFMLALIATGWANGAATRFWPAATLLLIGQALMLSPHLPPLATLHWSSELRTFDAGLVCWLGAIVWGSLLARRRRTGTPPLDALWLDFRDGYGLLWGLRVAERVNAAARIYAWPVELRWQGFRPRSSGEPQPSELPAEVQQALRQTLDNLLRRFVSPEWITRRVPDWDTQPPA